jgi:hypothetical protein
MADRSYIGMNNLPRGIRNNNPGNIKAEEAWQGQIGTDGPFLMFQTLPWGMRAIATDLANKMKRGLVTIRQIITTYAPPVENQTGPYIQSVVDDTGFSADQVLTMNVDTLAKLVRAIVNHENGETASYDYITDADIQQGISMMNSGLATLFKAAGVALLATIEDPAGNVEWGKVLIIVALVGGGIYLLKKIK